MNSPEPSGPAEDAAPVRYSLPEGRGRAIVLILLLALGICVSAYMAVPFLGALAWALTLAVLSWPLHRRIAAALGRPSAAALLSTLVVALVFAAPLALLAQRLGSEAAASAAYLQAKVSAGEIGRLIPPDSSLAAWLSAFAERVDFTALSASGAGWLGNFVPKFLIDSFTQVFEVIVTFYFLFFLLRDQSAAVGALRAYLPLDTEEADRLLRRAADTIHATIFGTVLVAFVQGALGGLMFWILGLPAPLLWGLVMTLLSVVPVLGAFVVWIPAAIFLALEGRLVEAAVLAAWGALVVGTIDNVLRPIVIGDRLGLHTAPAFVAMVGGVIWLGPPGFVVGPLAFTVTLNLIDILRARAAKAPPAP